MSKDNIQHYTSSQVRTGGVYATQTFTKGDILCIDNNQIIFPDGVTPVSALPSVKGTMGNLLMPDPVNQKLFSINVLGEYRWLPVNNLNITNITNLILNNVEHGMIYYFPCRVRIIGYWFWRTVTGPVNWSMRVYDFNITTKLPTTLIYTSAITNITTPPMPAFYEHSFVPYAVDLDPGYYVIGLALHGTTAVGYNNISAANRFDTFGIYSNQTPLKSIYKFVRTGIVSAPFTAAHYNSVQSPLLAGPRVVLI